MDERRMGPRESADGAGNPQNAGTGGGGAGGGGISTDAELSVRAIVFFGAGLGVTMIVICAIVWLMVVWFKGRAEELDPARSPLAEANAPRLPPEPRLQGTPVADMRRLRAEEEAILTTYDWVDRPAGIARIPVDRAIDILAEKGLPTPPPLPAPPPSATPPAPAAESPTAGQSASPAANAPAQSLATEEQAPRAGTKARRMGTQAAPFRSEGRSRNAMTRP